MDVMHKSKEHRYIDTIMIINILKERLYFLTITNVAKLFLLFCCNYIAGLGQMFLRH